MVSLDRYRVDLNEVGLLAGVQFGMKCCAILSRLRSAAKQTIDQKAGLRTGDKSSLHLEVALFAPAPQTPCVSYQS